MIAEIRTLYATGDYSQAALGRQFGVHQGHVSRVLHADLSAPRLRSECRACEAARTRDYSVANREEVNAANREHMHRRRQDPKKREAMREAALRHYHERGGREKQREAKQRLKRDDPLRWHAQFVRRYRPDATVDDLRRLWESQDGRCALTGRPLEHGDAQVDHIAPQARGGTHEWSNLRWVCRRANEAKRDLTDEEFLALCRDVVARADL